jgi:hypothetical protein
VCHDHPSAAVAFATELVHRITTAVSIHELGASRSKVVEIPIWNAIIEKLEVSLPQVADDLGKL